MRLFILTLFVAALFAPAKGAAAEQEKSAAKEKSAIADVVKAAKEAKSRRKQSSTKVLTNADVKNAKGTLIILPTPAGAPADEAGEGDGLSMLDRHDEEYRLRLEAAEKVAAAEGKVAQLERELEQAELRYYEENDPDRRDNLIRQLFEETQKKLAAARAELELLKPKAEEKTENQQ